MELIIVVLVMVGLALTVALSQNARALAFGPTADLTWPAAKALLAIEVAVAVVTYTAMFAFNDQLVAYVAAVVLFGCIARTHRVLHYRAQRI